MDKIDFGVLQPLIDDPDVSEIMVNSADSIQCWHKWDGRKVLEDINITDAELRQIAEQIASSNGVTLDRQSPIVDARLHDGTRALIIMPPVSARGVVMRIGKPIKNDMTFERLVEINAMSVEAAQFLQAAVQVSSNIAVVGGWRSGKTTLLNVLADHINEDSRIAVIQPMESLDLSQPHIMYFEARQAALDGSPNISNEQLINTALQLRVDRLLVTDLEGGEVPALVKAMDIGHGAMFAMEGISSQDAIQRLESMATSGSLSTPLLTIREQIARSLDLIVYMELMDDGFRRMVQIDEVRGVRGDAIELVTIFSRDSDVPGTLNATGHVPHLLERIKSWRWSEIELDDTMFSVE